jgi:hypothetical protein
MFYLLKHLLLILLVGLCDNPSVTVVATMFYSTSIVNLGLSSLPKLNISVEYY